MNIAYHGYQIKNIVNQGYFRERLCIIYTGPQYCTGETQYKIMSDCGYVNIILYSCYVAVASMLKIHKYEINIACQ